jgi:putative heme-binding domain-containing protein
MDVPPTRGDFGIQNPRIVSPGNPYHSTLLYRILTSGPGRMPIIGSSSIDVEGVFLLRDWIESMDKGSIETNAPFHAEKMDTTSTAMSTVFNALNPSSPDRDAIIMTGLDSDSPITRDLFEIFLPPEKRRKSLGAGFDPMTVLSLTGNEANGKGLFFSATGSQCYTCHQIKNDGNDFGPNLSLIGSKYSKPELLRHSSQPSSNIDSEWIASMVETNDDELYSGFITERNPGNLKIKIAADNVVKIATDSITVESTQSLSLMPEGLLDNMTAQDAADLIEFLSVLR